MSSDSQGKINLNKRTKQKFKESKRMSRNPDGLREPDMR